MRKQISTSIEAELLKDLKIYCAENDYNLNDVIENSLYLFLSIGKDKKMTEIIDNIPCSRTGCKIQSLLDNQG